MIFVVLPLKKENLVKIANHAVYIYVTCYVVNFFWCALRSSEFSKADLVGDFFLTIFLV